MTEWEMQVELAKDWLKHGVDVSGTHMMLAAREVMVESWETNDSFKRWNEPSVDFILIDREGGLWVVELKRRLGPPRECWSALAQVSFGAVRLKKSFTFARIEQAYRELRLANEGCGPAAREIGQAHMEFYGLDREVVGQVVAPPFGRVVAAVTIGSNWSGILSEFRGIALDSLKSHPKIAGYATAKGNREIKRLQEINPADWPLDEVASIQVSIGTTG